jgi:multiple sugar transport system permease protein
MRNKKLVNYAKYGYIFSIPFIVTFLIFTLYPVVYTFVIGFTDLKGAGNTEWHWLPSVGKNLFANFKDVLTSKTFGKAFRNTWIIWGLNFVPQLGFALLFTAWFTDRRSKVKGTGLFKILFYMPNIITAATMAILFAKLFGYPIGAVNQLFNGTSADKAYNFLAYEWPIKFIVAFVQFFQWYGHTMVNLIAGVIGISPEIFEAAEIDGANRVQTFFRITIPCIRQIMLFILVTSLIGGLNMFDIPQLLVGPKAANGAALTTNMYIRNQAFDGSYLYNRAAAASVILFLIIVVLSSILFFIMRDKDEAKLKKLRKAELRAAKKGF